MLILVSVWPDFLKDWEVPILVLFALSYLIVLVKIAEEGEGYGRWSVLIVCVWMLGVCLHNTEAFIEKLTVFGSKFLLGWGLEVF